MRFQRLLCLSFAIAFAPAMRGQWLHYPTPGIPRTADGKPNLSAPAPRTADGKPDLAGLWQTEGASPKDLARLLPGANGTGEETPPQYFLNILDDYRPEEPLLPEVAAAFRDRTKNFATVSPLSHCLPAGIPLAELAPGPYKILQTPGLIAMLYERDTNFRQVYTDGRPLPTDPSPSWMGYSTGKWDGDTLVVETVGLTERSWLDVRGHTHSDSLKLTERFRRIDFGHMEVQFTMVDPKTFTKPVTFTAKQRLRPDTDVLEYFCSENERDLQHFR